MKLATSLAMAAILVCSGAAFGIEHNPSNALDLDAMKAIKDLQVFGINNPETQVGGEDVATAANIPALPYSDSGNTCAYLHDYDEICNYSGSLSPDVVYKFSPGADMSIDVDICTSLYDTKVYVYENAAGALIACNDDACGDDGFKSQLTCVPLTAGNTYYIVVDGYGSDCGDYNLSVDECIPASVDCPDEGVAEGEPSGGCAPDYSDAFNGGCNSVPPVFSSLPCSTDGASVFICGGYGGFDYFGLGYRDTDWYVVDPVYNTAGITACAVGTHETVLGYITVLPCAQVSAFDDYVITPPMVQGCINIPAGNFWIFVGTSTFGSATGCGEYVLELSGYDCGSVSVEPSTWGATKELYR